MTTQAVNVDNKKRRASKKISRKAGTAKSSQDPLIAALKVARYTQADSGAWPCDYSGPLFLLPMYIGTCYALGEMPDAITNEGMRQYLRHHQNADGGWGLHVEGTSTVLRQCSITLLCANSASATRTTRPCNVPRQSVSPQGGALASGAMEPFFSASWGCSDTKG
ncbi:MAG: prenyltransferase/squalene oxidase repeat-containing protein [Myxococcota bacterium]